MISRLNDAKSKLKRCVFGCSVRIGNSSELEPDEFIFFFLKFDFDKETVYFRLTCFIFFMNENNISSLVVSNLSFNVAEGHLKEIFENYGKIIDVKLSRNKFGQSLQWALITFETPEMMNNAILNMNGGQIDGLVIAVRQADPNIDNI